jgi:hypothetical protein
MARRPDARALLFERIRTTPAKFVQVRGVPYAVAVEEASDPLKLDHVWLTLEVPPFGRLRVAINTLSRANRDAGFDCRVRVAIVNSTYTEKPATGLEECAGQDYAHIEATQKIVYQPYEREALTELLVAKLKTAIRAEVWGELYARDHLGIHQIHCRRASSAVKADFKNRDGALKLYYPTDNLAELFLFKFAGQP